MNIQTIAKGTGIVVGVLFVAVVILAFSSVTVGYGLVAIGALSGWFGVAATSFWGISALGLMIVIVVSMLARIAGTSFYNGAKSAADSN